jgi:hypothetical protein
VRLIETLRVDQFKITEIIRTQFLSAMTFDQLRNFRALLAHAKIYAEQRQNSQNEQNWKMRQKRF